MSGSFDAETLRLPDETGEARMPRFAKEDTTPGAPPRPAARRGGRDENRLVHQMKEEADQGA